MDESVTRPVDLFDLDRQALESTRRFVHATTTEHLDASTPCAEWSVADLLNHVVSNNLLYAAAANGERPDWGQRRADHLGGDHRGAYDRSADEATAAFTHSPLPAVLELPYGPIETSAAISIHFVDVLVHGWDLATATGQEAALDDDLCRRALAIVDTYPAETWGDPRFFAHRLDLPADEPPYRRLVAALGRG